MDTEGGSETERRDTLNKMANIVSEEQLLAPACVGERRERLFLSRSVRASVGLESLTDAVPSFTTTGVSTEERRCSYFGLEGKKKQNSDFY